MLYFRTLGHLDPGLKYQIGFAQQTPHAVPAHSHRPFLPPPMSSAPSRFIFVFVLIVNCILWSRSRYGEPLQASFLHAGPSDVSLVKRISFELSQPQETRISTISKHEVGHVQCLISLIALKDGSMPSVNPEHSQLTLSANMSSKCAHHPPPSFTSITCVVIFAPRPL